MGPRSLTPEQQTRLMRLKKLSRGKPNASFYREDIRKDMQMQQRDALDEFYKNSKKKLNNPPTRIHFSKRCYRYLF